jgi:formate hydrogenlyase subunit 6/NADH:ubiquinone oxidoreductase subunit I
MRISIFSSIAGYLSEVFNGLRSVFNAFAASLPYVFGMGELRKEVTEQYPDPISSKTPDELPSRSRGLLHNTIEKCTGCGDCERICPSRCIQIETEPGPDSSQNWVSRFDIDISRCVFCGLCVEVCPPASLVHTRHYEGAVYHLEDLVASFGRGAVSAGQRAHWEKIRDSAASDEVFI